MCARAASQIITDSRYCKERIVHHYGVQPERVTVVYGALDRTWLEPDEKAIAQAWSGLKGSLPNRYVLGVGRMDPRKNFVLNGRITRRLQSLGLTDGLVLVGPDDFGAQAIKTQLRRDGLDSLVVRLIGLTATQIQAVYRHAQCLLFLSLAEGFGLPPLEAMAMGTPVVASNRTSIPEVCGRGAVIVNPDDEAAVFRSCRLVMNDLQLRDALVARGHEWVQGFRADRMVADVLEVYRKAVGK
jgi:glycosyltransferase involved in cell wall biosynthesis